MQGEYIEDRWIVGMIQSLCLQRGIEFSSWSDDWILELRKQDTTHRVIGFRFDINDSVASQIAQDKAATHATLALRGLSSIPHHVIRKKLSDNDKELLRGWGRIIMKPLTGSGGRDVRSFDDVRVLSDYVQSSMIHAWAASPLVPIENETRIILLDGEVLLSYAKRPVEIKGIKMFNLSLGSTVIATEPSAEQIYLARQAQAAVGLRLCAVDLVQGDDLQLAVLEVNDAFGMEHYARVSDHNKKRAEEVYGTILDTLFE